MIRGQYLRPVGMPTRSTHERVHDALVYFVSEVSLMSDRPEWNSLPLVVQMELTIARKAAARAFDAMPKEAS